MDADASCFFVFVVDRAVGDADRRVGDDLVAAMIPVGALIAAAVIAARYASQQKTSEGGRGPVVHSTRTWQGRSAVFAVVWILVVPVWLLFLGAGIGDRSPLFFALGLALTPIVLPWPIARFIALPLGLPRLASTMGLLADFTWGRDRAGGALIAAVLAVAKHQRPRDVAWVRQKLQSTTLTGAGAVVAAALLADLDGDRATADRLLAALPSFDPRVVPKTARHIVAERAIVQRFAAGDVGAVAALDDEFVGFSFFARFARACARRISGAVAPSPLDDLRLRLWWLLAPRRRRTRSLLAMALSATPAQTSEPEPEPTTTPLLALPQALALHVATTTQTTPPLSQVTALAAAWDPALKAATSTLTARARALGVHDVDGVARGVEDTVTQALCALVEKLDLSTVSVASTPPLLQRAIEEVRTARLDALEIAASGLRQRVESVSDIAPIDELREFAAVKGLYDDVARTGDDARALAYDAVQWTVCEIAVRLWNVRKEHRLANAMFRWLLAEATRLNDTRGVDTQSANVKCGP